MATRLELSNLLHQILDSNNVYFQPPEGLKMNYPAIVYSLENFDRRDADNIPYTVKRQYLVTLIHKDPDNIVVEKLVQLPLCRFNHHFTKDNLNHYSFSLYF